MYQKVHPQVFRVRPQVSRAHLHVSGGYLKVSRDHLQVLKDEQTMEECLEIAESDLKYHEDSFVKIL